jgi:hypothetical protein
VTDKQFTALMNAQDYVYCERVFSETSCHCGKGETKNIWMKLVGGILLGWQCGVCGKWTSFKKTTYRREEDEA